jgi:hypothetical protein
MMNGGLANSKAREKFLKYYVSNLNCSFILRQKNTHFVGTVMLQILTMLILFYRSHGHKNPWSHYRDIKVSGSRLCHFLDNTTCHNLLMKIAPTDTISEQNVSVEHKLLVSLNH